MGLFDFFSDAISNVTSQAGLDDIAGQASEAANDVTAQAGDVVSDATNGLSDQAGTVAEDVTQKIEEAKDTFSNN